MKVAIVGIGNMGSKYINKFKDLGYEAVLIDKEKEQLDKYSDEFIKYQDLEEALEKENIQTLFVATAPTSHIPIAEKALQRGINTMVEKPPALDPVDLYDAIELAKKNNAILGVSEIELRSNCIRNFDKNINISNIEAYRLNLRSGYINPFFDLAWHDLYIFHYLAGEFKINNVEDIKEDEMHLVKVNADSKTTHIDLQVAWNSPNLRREWILETEKEKIVFDFVEDKIIYSDGTVKEKDNVDKLELMIKEFVENPSFESSYRALNILNEFVKFKP